VRANTHHQTDVETRLQEVDWGSFDTAYGSASQVPQWLWDVRFGKPAFANEGTHMLWCSLCHQKGQLATAAEPALPFLLEFMPHVDATIQVEILDILHGLAVCSYPGNGYPASGHYSRVRAQLQAALPNIAALRHHRDEEARDFVRHMIKVLDDSSDAD
jgi:hypothetical protein